VERDDRQRVPRTQMPWPARLWRHKLRGVCVPGGIVVLLLVPLQWLPLNGKPLVAIEYEFLTHLPEFCVNCHLMQTRYVSWRRSSHANAASCIDCHSEPGFRGQIKANITGARYPYALVTGDRSGSVIEANVSSSACLKCHASSELTLEVHGASPGKTGDECTACHDHRMVHPLSMSPRDRRVTQRHPRRIDPSRIGGGR